MNSESKIRAAVNELMLTTARNLNPVPFTDAAWRFDADEDEEKKAREDRAKADAEAGTKLDKLLTHMDSFGDRFDSLNKRMDAFEEKDKARDDAEKAKCDAEEEAKKKEAADAADPEMIAADKKRKDAEEEEAKKKADAEEEDEKKKADAARGDSASIADIRKEVAALAARTPRFASSADNSHAAFADAQARADGVYNMFGKQARPPMQSEDLNTYRLALAKELQPYSDVWKGSNLSVVAVDSQAFENAECDIYESARRAAMSPVDLAEGQERVMTRTDKNTNRTVVEFARKDSFVRDLGTPPLYITRFNTDNNRSSAN